MADQSGTDFVKMSGDFSSEIVSIHDRMIRAAENPAVGGKPFPWLDPFVDENFAWIDSYSSGFG